MSIVGCDVESARKLSPSSFVASSFVGAPLNRFALLPLSHLPSLSGLLFLLPPVLLSLSREHAAARGEGGAECSGDRQRAAPPTRRATCLRRGRGTARFALRPRAGPAPAPEPSRPVERRRPPVRWHTPPQRLRGGNKSGAEAERLCREAHAALRERSPRRVERGAGTRAVGQWGCLGSCGSWNRAWQQLESCMHDRWTDFSGRLFGRFAPCRMERRLDPRPRPHDTRETT